MIQIEVSAFTQGSFANITSTYNLTWSIGPVVSGSYPDDRIRILLTGAGKPGSVTTNVPIGRLVQGHKAWGDRREKDVTHLTASGLIKCATKTIQVGSYDGGCPYAEQPNGTKIPFDQFLYWGESFSMTKSGTYGTGVYQGDTYTRDLTTVSSRLVYNSDQSKVAYVTVMNPGVIYRNGSVYRDYQDSTEVIGYYLNSDRSITSCGRAEVVGVLPDSAIVSLLTGWTSSGVQMDTLGDLLVVDQGSLNQVVSGMEIILEEFFKDLNKGLTSAGVLDLSLHPVDFGELALECAKQLQHVDTNLLGLVFDIDDWRQFHTLWKSVVNAPGWKSAWRSFTKVAKLRDDASMRDLINIFKPASSSYLFEKYAIMTSVSDLKKLAGGLSKAYSTFSQSQKIHSRRVTALEPAGALSFKHTAVMTVKCSQFSSDVLGRAMDLIAEAKRWGVYPQLTNLWDILPYSFCVDWFIQFGDFFKQCDDYLNVRDYFPVEFAMMSEKWEKEVSSSSILPDYPVSGVVKFTYYTRWITRELPLPSVSLTAESTVDKHLLESTALILQRL